MEAQAALRSSLRRHHGRGSEVFLKDIPEEPGVVDSTRQDLAPVGRKRSKKGSNAEGRGPADPKERIKRVTDGSTHPAYAAEHAMATESGAIISVTIQDATVAERTTKRTTMQRAMENLCSVIEDPERAGQALRRRGSRRRGTT